MTHDLYTSYSQSIHKVIDRPRVGINLSALFIGMGAFRGRVCRRFALCIPYFGPVSLGMFVRD